MAAYVHEHNVEVRNLRRRVGDFPKTTEARGRRVLSPPAREGDARNS